MVDALRQHNEVTLATLDADPAVIQVPHIKVACNIQRSTSSQQEGTELASVPAGQGPLLLLLLLLLLLVLPRTLCSRAHVHHTHTFLVCLCCMQTTHSTLVDSNTAQSLPGWQLSKHSTLYCNHRPLGNPSTPHTSAIQDVPDLLIFVNVLFIEHLDLVLIARQLVLGDLNDLLQQQRHTHQVVLAFLSYNFARLLVLCQHRHMHTGTPLVNMHAQFLKTDTDTLHHTARW